MVFVRNVQRCGAAYVRVHECGPQRGHVRVTSQRLPSVYGLPRRNEIVRVGHHLLHAECHAASLNLLDTFRESPVLPQLSRNDRSLSVLRRADDGMSKCDPAAAPMLGSCGDSTCLPGVDAPQRVRRAIRAGDALQQQRAHAERRRLLGGCLCDDAATWRTWLESEHDEGRVGLMRGGFDSTGG